MNLTPHSVLPERENENNLLRRVVIKRKSNVYKRCATTRTTFKNQQNTCPITSKSCVIQHERFWYYSKPFSSSLDNVISGNGGVLIKQYQQSLYAL